MSGEAGSVEPDGLQIAQLIKQLCIVQTKDQLDRVSHLPAKRRRLLRSQLDVAYDILLGLRPEDAPRLSDQEDLEILVPEGLDAVQDSLRLEEYPELADSLASLLTHLDTCTSCTVIGTPVQEVTGRPATVPLPDRTQLLAFLLSLQGSSASIRRRQATFQHQYETATATASSSEAYTSKAGGGNTTNKSLGSNTGPALRSDIFLEAPDPHALFSVTGTSVLLPGECFGGSGGGDQSTHSTALEGNEGEVEGLDSCMDARPVWAPASAQGGLLSLAADGGGWLHIPESLTNMRNDPRRTAPPPSLGVPLGALAIDASPGSVTAFQDFKGSRSPLLSPLLSSSRRGGGLGASLSPIKALIRSKSAAVAENNRGRRTDDASSLQGSANGALVIRWTEDADLARDSVLALQGVHSALLRLRGVLAAPHALPITASAGLLQPVERAATLRQNIERFIAAITATQKDPVLVAFATAVYDVLRQITEELSRLELEGGKRNTRNAAVEVGTGTGGKIFRSRPISLLHTTAATKSVQTRIRSLASLCWSAPSQANEPCGWELQEPPAGVALLEYLFRQAQGADGQYQRTVQYLFARAAHPYLVCLRRWAFSTSRVDSSDFYTTAATANSLDLAPPVHGTGDHAAPSVIKTRTATLIPGPLPAFMSHWRDVLMNAGTQLRLLHSVDCAQGLVSDLLTVSPPVESEFLDSAAIGDSRWLNLDPKIMIKNKEFYGSESAEAELLISSGQAHAFLAACANNELSRGNIVNLWLQKLQNERLQSEISLKSGFTATAERLQDERIAADASKLEILERRRSIKAALMEEQLEALGAARLAKLGLTPSGLTEQPSIEKESMTSSSAAAAVDADGLVHMEVDVETKDAKQKFSLGPLLDGLMPSSDDPPISAHPHSLPGSLAPIPLALQALLGSSIQSQALVISRACVGLFQDHLSLLGHLSFLRRTFFLGAGDWANAFLGPLAERVAGLQPLDAHSVHNMLQDALRTSSLENEPFAASLRVELLPGPTAPSTFLTALEAEPGTAGALPQLPRGRAAAPVLVVPARLDGLDCLLLRYKTSWPLATILTEDTSVGYAAVFSAMLRVRRAGLLLKRLRRPLAARTRPAPAPSKRTSSAGLGSNAVAAAEALMSSDTAALNTAQQRLQQVRRFVHAASHFVAAVQLFQGSCTSGAGWNTLAPKLDPAAHPETRCSNTQELVDLHRAYVHEAASDCLTYCGNATVQTSTEASLAAVLEVANLIEAAVVAGEDSVGVSRGGGVSAAVKGTWARKLSDSGTWKQIELGMRAFATAGEQLRQALSKERGSSASNLGNLSAVLYI